MLHLLNYFLKVLLFSWSSEGYSTERNKFILSLFYTKSCNDLLERNIVSCHQGNPPFEKPTIAKGISNFVSYKFGHLPQNDWQTMFELSKLFLHCLNFWKLETPSSIKLTMPVEDVSSYKV